MNKLANCLVNTVFTAACLTLLSFNSFSQNKLGVKSNKWVTLQEVSEYYD